MVIVLIPFLFVMFYTRVLLFVMLFQLPLPFYTAV